MVDNHWVVPYNAWLLLRYDYHINVEIYASIKNVKYLYKYIYKGPDRVAVEVQSDRNFDEIRQFVDARWVCAPEALWKIFKFVMNKIYPIVERLQIHLPHMQQVRFDVDETIEDILANERTQKSMLTKYFATNYDTDPVERRYLYREFPQYYRWDKENKRWEKRRNNVKVIGRIYSVSPAEGKKFYLRVHLNHVRGPISFRDFHIVNGIFQPTIKQAAERQCLLEDDNNIRQCLLESSTLRMASTLKRLFATILLYNEPIGVQRLWDEFYPFMVEDYCSSSDDIDIYVKNMLLQYLNTMLEQFNKSVRGFDLPEISSELENSLRMPRCIEDELSTQIPQDEQ